MENDGVGSIKVITDPVGRLSERAVLAALREAFEQLAFGAAAQPPQLMTLLPDGGDVITYQGVLADTYGVKVSPYLPDGIGGGQVTAWTLLLSSKTGRPLLLCDSKQLTTERTAATTALAVDLLAPPQAATLAIVGAGPIAQAHLRYARVVREFRTVRAYSPGLASGARRPTSARWAWASKTWRSPACC
jgi:L-arginine dehydrogenase